jgi:uncharacterized protein
MSGPPSTAEVRPEPKWAGRPRPARTRDTDFWWDGLAVGELRIQRCEACGHLQHPPEPRCMYCGGDQLGWLVASGRGEVFSFVVYHEPVLPGFDYPYVAAVITLEEGLRVIADVVGVEPGRVAVGDPVQASFHRVDDQLTLLAFGPARDEPGRTDG